MKYIFLGCLVALLIASAGTWASLPSKTTEKPILYWVSDPNPVRQSQVEAFHVWMEEHVPPEDHFQLVLDAANNSPHKKVIQSVSGVGGEIMDVYGAGNMHYFHKMGVIEDLTEMAKPERYDFQASKVNPVIEPQLSVDGRQYMFPCNISADFFWVNKAALAKHGLSMPEPDWTFADLEREGQLFGERANQGLDHPRFFYLSHMTLVSMIRGQGVDTMNETLTAAAVDDPIMVESLDRLRRWRYDLHIIPTLADMQSITTESAHGGSTTQLFRTGNIPILARGRWALCQFREWEDFKDMELGLLPPPVIKGGFRNAPAGTRAAVMYAGASPRHKELAAYFFQFLASPAYSKTIIDSGDALPPLVSATQTEDFRRPAGFENEWGIHESFAHYFSTYGVASSESPFVTSTFCGREMKDAEDALMTNPPLRTAAQSAVRAAERINDRIALNLAENPSLRPAYDEACERQRIIDAHKAAGEKIPAELISNVYHLRYYRAKGMLAE